MARLYDSRNAKREGSAVRPILVAVFLLVVLLPAAWLMYLPMMQIYWATYARLAPMRSDVIIEGTFTFAGIALFCSLRNSLGNSHSWQIEAPYSLSQVLKRLIQPVTAMQMERKLKARRLLLMVRQPWQNGTA